MPWADRANFADVKVQNIPKPLSTETTNYMQGTKQSSQSTEDACTAQEKVEFTTDTITLRLGYVGDEDE